MYRPGWIRQGTAVGTDDRLAQLCPDADLTRKGKGIAQEGLRADQKPPEMPRHALEIGWVGGKPPELILIGFRRFGNK